MDVSLNWTLEITACQVIGSNYIFNRNIYIFFVGSFPDDVECLSKLKVLVLDGNHLTGETIELHIIVLMYYYAYKGSLPGYVLNHLTSLEVFSVRRNKLSGEILLFI
jgi:hypothetical protein